MYFPSAIEAVARQSWAGNEKHNPGEPLHWAREKSSDHMDCAARHMMTPNEIDPETGETHLVAAAWRILAALQLQQEAKASGERHVKEVPVSGRWTTGFTSPASVFDTTKLETPS